MLRKMTLALVSVFMTFISCKSRPSSHLSHEEGQSTAASVPALWLDASLDQYSKFVLTRLKESYEWLKDDNYSIGPDAQEYKDLQLIIDQFDSALRAKDPSAMKPIPKPKLMLIPKSPKAPVINAFVAQYPVCLNVPIVFQDKMIEPFTTTDGERLDLYYKNRGYSVEADGAFSLDRSVNFEECIHKDISSSDLQQLVTWINQNSFDRRQTQCTLSATSIDGKDAVRVESSCRIDPDLARMVARGDFIIIKATGNFVTVFSDLVTLLNDKNQIASVVAHELAHYYKAHASGNRSIQNYFYDLAEYKNHGYPPEKNELDRIGRLATLITPPGNLYEKPSGTSIQPELYGLIVDLINNGICDDDHFCPSSCKNINRPTLLAVNDTPQKFDPQSAKAFEDLVAKCFASDIKILHGSFARHDFSIKNKDTASVDAEAIEKHIRDDHGAFGIGGDAYIYQCIDSFPEFARLDELLQRLNEKVTSPLCNQRFVLAEAAKHRMGYYTYEQEADDLGLELLFSAKIPVNSMEGAMLRLAESEGDAGCQKWQESQKGRPIPILKSYEDVHHETCFRWHEITQEIKRHGYLDR